MVAIFFSVVCELLSLKQIHEQSVSANHSAMYKKAVAVIGCIIIVIIMIYTSWLLRCLLFPLLVTFIVYGIGDIKSYCGMSDIIEFEDAVCFSENEEKPINDKISISADNAIHTSEDIEISSSEIKTDQAPSKLPSLVYLGLCQYFKDSFSNINFIQDTNSTTPTFGTVEILEDRNEYVVVLTDSLRQISFRIKTQVISDADKDILFCFFKATLEKTFLIMNV